MALLILLLCCHAGCAASPRFPVVPADAVKPVLAVSHFENRSGFPGKWELGNGMADVLLAELVASQHFVLVERRDLGLLLQEIQDQSTSHFRQEGRAQPGQLKNAQYFIRGVVTDFTHVSNAHLKAQGSHWIGGASGFTARVAITLTVVDVESGQIVDSISSDGYARASGVYADAEYRGVRFGGDAFFRTPLGLATREAIRKGILGLIASIPKDRWTPRIAEIDNRSVIITGGQQWNQQPGMLFDVMGPDRIITDPTTGDELEALPGLVIGQLRVIQINQRTSICEVIRGAQFERGLRLKQVVIAPE